MDSNKYLKELNRRLKKLPNEERESAIAYYTEYFAEAGPSREKQVMDQLGSPKQIAAVIMADFTLDSIDKKKPKAKSSLSAIGFGIVGVWASSASKPLLVIATIIIIILLVLAFIAIICLYAVAAALAFGGLLSLGVGIALGVGLALGAQDIGASLFYMGSGIACVAISVLLGFFVFWLCRKILKSIAYLTGRIRHRDYYRQQKNQEVRQND